MARRAHSSVERKVTGAGARSAFGASGGSGVRALPSRGSPGGGLGGRRAWSGIGLCSREAHSSRNGPPSSDPQRASTCAGAESGAKTCGCGCPCGGGTCARALAGPTPSLSGPHRQDFASRPPPPAEHQNRSSPHPTPTPDISYRLSSPSPAALLALPSRFTPSGSKTTPSASLVPLLDSLPPPRLSAPSSAPGLTRRVYVAGRGRGVRREAADSPSSLSRAWSQGNNPQAGRRPVALRQAGSDGDFQTRISVLGRGSTRNGPTEEVSR